MTKREYVEKATLIMIEALVKGKGYYPSEINDNKKNIVYTAINLYNLIDEECMPKLNNPPINIPSNSLSSGTYSDD